MDSQAKVGFEQVLAEFNQTDRGGLVETLPELFERQVRAVPGNTAVICDADRLTYDELNQRANRLARLLVSSGAGPERLIALVLPRSLNMLVAIMAVSKAGAGYVPIDPRQPAHRIAALLSSAAPVATLTIQAFSQLLPGSTEKVVLDAHDTVALLERDAPQTPDRVNLSAPLCSDNVAYVIFTSGSTGAPKGVVMSHRGLASLAEDHVTRFGISPGEGVLQVASFTFDCSVGDMLMAFASGSALVIRPDDCLSDDELGALIERTGATHVTIPPQLLAALSPERCHGLRTIATAGDALSAELVRRWAPGRRMFNAYGPTESTVDALVAEVTEEAGRTVPPIGRPVLNTRAYLLDSDLRPVAAGDVGDLYLSGFGLARGYLNQPGMTADRFVPCPFARPGERMYRTGDLARSRPDGNLEFVGRADEQVKVRGFRIEPGEVEAVLNRHPGVDASVVAAREDGAGNKRLVAYVVGVRDAELDVGGLRSYVASELPDYMVPSAVVTLEAIPLTPNGKVDRRDLPMPDFSGGSSGVAPSNPRERILCELFGEVLGVENVGVDDDFFGLGGDSVMAIQLAARARREGWLLAPKDVFVLQRVEALADVLQPVADPQSVAESLDSVSDCLPFTPGIRANIAGASAAARWCRAIAVRLPHAFDARVLTQALQVVLDHHDALRICATDGREGRELRVLPAGSIDAKDRASFADGALSFEHSRVDALAADAASRLDLAAGCVAHVVQWSGGFDANGLLLAVDRIAADASSARIVLEDLLAVAADLEAGRPPGLVGKAAPFRRWAQHLAGALESLDLEVEADWWNATLATPDPPLGAASRGHLASDSREMKSLTVLASTLVTQQLVHRAGKAFNCGMEDVLLTALSLVIVEWRGRRFGAAASPVLLDIESSGRDGTANGMDLSRAVGSFAWTFPVALDPDPPHWEDVRIGGTTVGRAIKRVKEQLRAVPGGGIGFGLSNCAGAMPRGSSGGSSFPQVSFAFSGTTSLDEFADSVEPASWSTGIPLAHSLSVSALMRALEGECRLEMTCDWPSNVFSEADIESFAELWLEALSGIVAHVERPSAGGHTPSDLTLVSLSQDEIDEFDSEWTE